MRLGVCARARFVRVRSEFRQITLLAKIFNISGEFASSAKPISIEVFPTSWYGDVGLLWKPWREQRCCACAARSAPILTTGTAVGHFVVGSLFTCLWMLENRGRTATAAARWGIETAERFVLVCQSPKQQKSLQQYQQKLLD